MSEVTVKINHRGYGISCDPGQEKRLSDLASFVDSRLQGIADAGAASNEAHLFVLTSLVLADEVYELRDQLAALQESYAQNVSVPSGDSALRSEDEALLVQAIEHMAQHIETITKRVEAGRIASGSDKLQTA